jgi:glycosyltransferase involved in cell wall biosynthesis
LKETLQRTHANINEGDEIVLVDYGSTDGLIDWIQENRTSFVQVRTFTLIEKPDRWRVGHVKNVAHMCASNPIVCNLDADNWIVEGHSNFIVKNLVEGQNVLIASGTCNEGGRGRLAMFKTDFHRLGGYDERIESWGCDVSNFLERIDRSGMKMGIIKSNLVKFIKHGDAERGLHDPFQNKDQSAAHNKQFSSETFIRPSVIGKAWLEELE